MTKRRFIPLILAVSLALPVATLSSTAFAVEDPQDIEAPQQVPDPPSPPAEEESVMSVISDGTIEELPADVQDAIAAHERSDGLAQDYALEDLEEALADMPADCELELGAEANDILAACGVTVDPTPASEMPETDPSEGTTPQGPEADEQVEPSASPEDAARPDDLEPSDSRRTSGPAGGGMPVGGFSPVRVPAAVGSTCDGTSTAVAVSRNQTCAHHHRPVLDWIWQQGSLRLVGWANLEFYLLATSDPKSYRITLENKARVTIKVGTFNEEMPTMVPVTGLRNPRTADWIGIPTTFPHEQIADSSWHDFSSVAHDAPGMPRRAIRYYAPSFHFELRDIDAPLVINATGSFSGTAIRCDNRAVNGMGYGCVADYKPTLTYSKSGVESGVAIHIEKAQGLGAPAQLHREYPVGNNRSQSCPSSLWRMTGYECDEYPFNSAVEGGTSVGAIPNAHPIVVPDDCGWRPVDPPADSAFTPTSRCQVLRGQNRAGGNQLRAFYLDNRIINNDVFVVNIVP